MQRRYGSNNSNDTRDGTSWLKAETAIMSDAVIMITGIVSVSTPTIDNLLGVIHTQRHTRKTARRVYDITYSERV
jgi:hypothetical protein